MNGSGWASVTTKRLRVPRLDAQRRRRLLAGVHIAGVLDRIEIVGVGRGRLGIEDPPPGEHEILGRHRNAVRPRVIAQVEGPGQAVFGGLPGLGGARYRFALGVLGGQPEDHVAGDLGLPDAVDQGGVEALRFRAIATVEHDLIRGSRGGRLSWSASRLRTRRARSEPRCKDLPKIPAQRRYGSCLFRYWRGVAARACSSIVTHRVRCVSVGFASQFFT